MGTDGHFGEDEGAALRVQQLAAVKLRAGALRFRQHAELALGFLRAVSRGRGVKMTEDMRPGV